MKHPNCDRVLREPAFGLSEAAAVTWPPPQGAVAADPATRSKPGARAAGAHLGSIPMWVLLLAVGAGVPLEAQSAPAWAGNDISGHEVWDPATDSLQWEPGHPKGYAEGDTAAFAITIHAGNLDQKQLDICLDYDSSSNGVYAFALPVPPPVIGTTAEPNGLEPYDKTLKLIDSSYPNPDTPSGSAPTNGITDNTSYPLSVWGSNLTINQVTWLGEGGGRCPANYLAWNVWYTPEKIYSNSDPSSIGTIVYGGHIASPVPLGDSYRVDGTPIPSGMGAASVNGVFQARVSSQGTGDKTINFSGSEIIPRESDVELVAACEDALFDFNAVPLVFPFSVENLDRAGIADAPAKNVTLTIAITSGVVSYSGTFTSSSPATCSGAGTFADPLVCTLSAPLPVGSTWTLEVNTNTTGPGGVSVTAEASADNELPVNTGNNSGDCVGTTPVTLSSFEARKGKDGAVTFTWTTAMEVGNAGFRILGKNAAGQWDQLNDALISGAGSTDIPQAYSYVADAAAGYSLFRLVDVELGSDLGKAHGDFQLGKKYGQVPAVEPIDWKAIGKEHDSKKTVRDKERKAFASATVMTAASADGTANAAVDAADLVITKSGLYRVALTAAGVANVSPDRLGLFTGGQPVPMRVDGGYLEFVGQAVTSLYTKETPYQLKVVDPNQGAVVAIDSRTLPPSYVPKSDYLETLTAERQKVYTSAAPGADPWFDTWMNGKKSWTFQFNVDGYAGGPATLSLVLWGMSESTANPDHHLLVKLNTGTPKDVAFDGRGILKADLEFGAVQNGTNTLTLQMPRDFDPNDVIALDKYSVTYKRGLVARGGGLTFTGSGEAFTVTGLPSADVVVYRTGSDGRVTRMTGVEVAPLAGAYRASFPGTAEEATYQVASAQALPAPAVKPATAAVDCGAGGALDLLIVAHEDFMGGELDPLVSLRQGQGYSVQVVPVGGLYVQYTYGRVDPEAIRACVADAAARHVGTDPALAVLLVGGSSYDPMNNLGLGSLDFIPTFYTQTHRLVTYAPTDALIADTDRDRVPDVAIGRLPVRTSAELQNIVHKTLQYGTKVYFKKAVFAADDKPATEIQDFQADSEALQAMMEGWTITDAYFNDPSGVTGARTTLLNAINLNAINQGVALTAFVGHSAVNQWTFDGLFSAADAGMLSNAEAPTAVLQWGCFNTYFVYPYANTLGHKLMLNAKGGAAAVMGASTLSSASNATAMGMRMLDESVGGLIDGSTTVGEAMLRAKRDFAAAHPERLDMILGLQLLGDPLLMIDP